MHLLTLGGAISKPLTLRSHGPHLAMPKLLFFPLLPPSFPVFSLTFGCEPNRQG